jgi:hypothetical protein
MWLRQNLNGVMQFSTIFMYFATQINVINENPDITLV